MQLKKHGYKCSAKILLTNFGSLLFIGFYIAMMSVAYRLKQRTNAECILYFIYSNPLPVSLSVFNPAIFVIFTPKTILLASKFISNFRGSRSFNVTSNGGQNQSGKRRVTTVSRVVHPWGLGADMCEMRGKSHCQLRSKTHSRERVLSKHSTVTILNEIKRRKTRASGFSLQSSETDTIKEEIISSSSEGDKGSSRTELVKRVAGRGLRFVGNEN